MPAAGAAELRENRPDAQREPVMDDLPSFETHRVDNQPPPFEPRDLWADDLADAQYERTLHFDLSTVVRNLAGPNFTIKTSL